jgi:hypothetical protein
MPEEHKPTADMLGGCNQHGWIGGDTVCGRFETRAPTMPSRRGHLITDLNSGSHEAVVGGPNQHVRLYNNNSRHHLNSVLFIVTLKLLDLNELFDGTVKVEVRIHYLGVI